MRSILKIGFTTRIPTTYATIPFGYGANGCPFLLESVGDIDSFKIVCLKTGKETEISTGYIQEDTNKDAKFYTASHDLGVPSGNYYYKLISGGYDVNELSLTGAYNRASTPQAVAYGSYKFTILFDNQFTVHLINSSATTESDNYFIQFDKFGGIWFASGVTTLFRVSSGYLTVGNEYDIEVFRSPLGEFSVYVDGVLPTTSTGTNPITDNTITTSDYMYLESYLGGSKLINPSVNDIPIDVSTFTELEGTIIADTGIRGGTSLYSQVFRVDENMRLPDPQVGDYNQDYGNDYNNFEASGILDENGEPI